MITKLNRLGKRIAVAFYAAFGCLSSTCNADDQLPDRQLPFFVRPVSSEIDGQWAGNAICYGPYRPGQGPGGAKPPKQQLLEDLNLLVKHWKLLRVYGTRHFTRDMLEVIREEHLPLRVMLGAWIIPEPQPAGPHSWAARSNQQDVAMAIALTQEFPEIVWAVSVGNECQVRWSDHKVLPQVLIRYIRQVRAQTAVPVTTADDFLFWTDHSSQSVTKEVDFIVMHAHPVWNQKESSQALEFVAEKFEAVQRTHPDRVVVIGETGWATGMNLTGREKNLVTGQMNEVEQRTVCLDLVRWAKAQRVTMFLFEAFDESWKGSPHPDDVEKHWGLFKNDRTPKPAIQGFAKE